MRLNCRREAGLRVRRQRHASNNNVSETAGVARDTAERLTTRLGCGPDAHKGTGAALSYGGWRGMELAWTRRSLILGLPFVCGGGAQIPPNPPFSKGGEPSPRPPSKGKHQVVKLDQGGEPRKRSPCSKGGHEALLARSGKRPDAGLRPRRGRASVVYRVATSAMLRWLRWTLRSHPARLRAPEALVTPLIAVALAARSGARAL